MKKSFLALLLALSLLLPACSSPGKKADTPPQQNQTANDDKNIDVKALKEEVQAGRQGSKKSEPSTDTTTEPQGDTVYVTESGEKYHSDGCQYLRKSKIEISLAGAKASYTPCSKCGPPQ